MVESSIKQNEQRKTRSDKKRTIKPTLPLIVKNTVYRLSHITRTPVKDVAEKMCLFAIEDKNIIKSIAKKFRRDVRIDNTYYCGDITNASVVKRTQPGECERITLRLTGEAYEVIVVLAYALDCRPSRACALLIEESLTNSDFVNEYVKSHIEGKLDKNRMTELKKVMEYINRGEEEEYNWATLLSYIVDEVKKPNNVKNMVNDFIINHWKKP
ncbi:hypothetical protein ACQKND_16345 [Viridibacillus arvi]|uniref:hypothetical protein n=1 Tax=Viridibacillus arvi TaxID=263475 RepID=UPI003D0088AE